MLVEVGSRVSALGSVALSFTAGLGSLVSSLVRSGLTAGVSWLVSVVSAVPLSFTAGLGSLAGVLGPVSVEFSGALRFGSRVSASVSVVLLFLPHHVFSLTQFPQ